MVKPTFSTRWMFIGPTHRLNSNMDWQPERMIIIQSESAARAREWYDSAEYRPLRELRQRCAACKLIIVDGL